MLKIVKKVLFLFVLISSYHSYTDVVRAKAGKKQSPKDASGRAAHSAGGFTSSYNEIALKVFKSQICCLACQVFYFHASQLLCCTIFELELVIYKLINDWKWCYFFVFHFKMWEVGTCMFEIIITWDYFGKVFLENYWIFLLIYLGKGNIICYCAISYIENVYHMINFICTKNFSSYSVACLLSIIYN